MKNKLHPKILDLKLRAKPINYSDHRMVEEMNRLNLRAERTEDGKTKAYFCIWGVRDSYGTGWVKGAFTKSIKERGPDSNANQKIFIAWMHDITDPIGRPVEIREDKKGAYAVIEWDDPEAVPNSKRAQAQLESGTINGWSFGFKYVWDKMEYDEKTDTVWAKEADLYEISPVTIPSMRETMTISTRAEFEHEKFLLDDETDNLLSSLPRQKQLELRQLIHKHISLARIEPDSFDIIKGKTLNRRSKPKDDVISKLNKQLTKTNLFN